ncbi:hypothetical protein BDW72DRAFT_55467 [Aspergillus terricola var. indicus]
MAERRVCDSCHSRKVRCDRNDPCGNCLDQNTECTRSRRMRRLPKRDLSQMQGRARHHVKPSLRPFASGQGQSQTPSGRSEPSLRGRENDEDEFLEGMMEDQQLMRLGQFDADMNMNVNMDTTVGYGLHSWVSVVPLTEAQMINRRQLGYSQDLSWTRQQALESALSVAGKVLGSMDLRSETAPDEGCGQQRHIPSLEFLYWMLNDIGSDKFGPFISDYFRHIAREDLKEMGLALLFNTASSTESTFFTVCVNSIAFKFLNATLGDGPDNKDNDDDDDDDELARRLRHSALLYRETAKAALQKIPLITKPSFRLLQALLCGIFLHQGSGDTNACRELAKTACRVCMDIGLHPGAANLHALTEAEHYCFMWCYMLDRNYAWKFGGPRFLTVEQDFDISSTMTSSVPVAISHLFRIYLDLAKVQDAMIPFLNDPSKVARDNAFQPPTGVGTLLLQKMEGIRRAIHQIKEPSPNWKGLDPASEIATLNFAYHCILTNLLHLRQIAVSVHQTPTAEAPDTSSYLDSARRGLQALISLCTSSDKQKTVAYLHWTLLFYPITACIALLCNTIATSHSGDFAILTTVSHCLAQAGPLSPPIAAMQRLLQEFVTLSRCCFSAGDANVSVSGHGTGPLQLLAAWPALSSSPSSSSLGLGVDVDPIMMTVAGGLDSFALAGMSFMDMGMEMGVGDGDGDGDVGRNNGHAQEDQDRAQRQLGNGFNVGNARFPSGFA